MTGSAPEGQIAGSAVRAATPADLDAIAALEQQALGPDAWSRGLLAAGLSGEVPTVSYLVHEHPDSTPDPPPDTPPDPPRAIAGYAVLSCAGDIAEVQRIAVDQEHRRAGIATALLAAIRTRARANEADRLLLEVREDNAGARAFYRASGFAEIGVRRRYYADGASAVICSAALARGSVQ